MPGDLRTEIAVMAMPGRCSCLMARKTEALLGKSLSGKVRWPATGALGLPSRCLPLARSRALNLFAKQQGASGQWAFKLLPSSTCLSLEPVDQRNSA